MMLSGFVEALLHQLFPCLAFYKQSYEVLFFLEVAVWMAENTVI